MFGPTASCFTFFPDNRVFTDRSERPPRFVLAITGVKRTPYFYGLPFIDAIRAVVFRTRFASISLARPVRRCGTHRFGTWSLIPTDPAVI